MKKIILAIGISIGISMAPAMADTIRTSDGISCSFDSDDNPYEVSSYIESGQLDSSSNSSNYYDNRDQDDKKIGIKFTYTFGGPKRLECDKLYQLELRSKDAKVKELEAKLAAMEAAQDIKW